MSVKELESIFQPRSIAVVGASENPMSPGNWFIQHLLDYGFRGQIYPITASQSEVFGIKAYPSLKDVPKEVDYIICCVPAVAVIDLLNDCPQKGVKGIHLYTGRFSETGLDEPAKLEQEILQRAKEVGVRMIGPNCMGMYHPKEGISFVYDLPKEGGSVGMFLQSGGASGEFIRNSALRGIRFSKVVSYGNALDLNECDYLEYFLQDSETKIIAAYIEGVKDGRRFFSLLKEGARSKPIVLLKAGLGIAGSQSVASHTGSLAGSVRMWETALRQTGAINAQSLEEMIDIVVGLCFSPPFSGRRVAVVGGGGGKSVLSADGWETAGFSLPPLTKEIREEIKEKLPEMWWDWVGNPVDVSMLPPSAWGTGLTGNMLRMMSDSPEYDIIVCNLTTDAPVGKDALNMFIEPEANQVMKETQNRKKPIVVILNGGLLGIQEFDDWRWRMIAEQQSRFVEAQIPVFPTIGQAANTMRKLADYYEKTKS